MSKRTQHATAVVETRADKIANLEACLKELRAEEAAELEALRDSVKPVYRYTVALAERSWDVIYDDTCALYSIRGECVNKAEVEAVGNSTHEGSMTYLFNRATGSIVMATGGGSIFIGAKGFGFGADKHVVATMKRVSDFIVANPDGGDITEIVVAHQKKVGDED